MYKSLCVSVSVCENFYEIIENIKKTHFFNCTMLISSGFLSVFVFIITVYVLIVFHISCSVSL